MRKLIFILVLMGLYLGVTAFSAGKPFAPVTMQKDAEKLLKKQILTEAAWAMKQEPITVTASSSPRSAGRKHDFFSEADYFWPDPKTPDGPYINRDGLTNPDNFVEHRKAMIRFSKVIGALASAYKLTGDEKYVLQAVKHFRAWFINAKTLMNPNLLFAQAVKGKFTGRNYGIMDTIHLMEVAQGALVMQRAKTFDKNTLAGVKQWFADYTLWLNTSKPGIQEKTVKNNHATCWAMQAASFARLCGDEKMLDSLRNRYKTILLPNQMGTDGSFPLETARTKPYGYSIFNLDAMTMLCQILSTPQDNLWTFETPDGKSIKKGIAYLYPFVADKSKWTLQPDVMYWNNWPVAQPFLLFGAVQFDQKNWYSTWAKLDHQPQVEEVIRNLPIRNPIIWF
ncbi:alginate lyase family protein [Pedobacter endophyticus]|uniref:Alginate lyase family protein n=1 Tax=Pedobacter endophyticus TaxID=2789740 RepID=A0A7S9L1E0_9SPHI|nr:alginate lyase family protein [Pedobacter endophyticus]QPH40346.1 alginate lyase family protein [Pedobacter endophyticus]